MEIVDEISWPHLARAVQDRRLALGLSVPAVLAKIDGGIARNTWEAMEKGTRRISKRKWANVERALDWQPGSVQSVVGGGAPTLARPAVTAPPSDELEHELDRIRALDVPPRLRRKLLVAMIEMFEAEQHEHASNEYKSVS